MSEHYSVLLSETTQALNPKDDGLYVDGTLGRAGHSKKLLSMFQRGHLYAFDKDLEAIEKCKEILKDEEKRISIFHNDFSEMKQVLMENGVTYVDGIMLDLGVSSPQFDKGDRGFSYRFDARLDMRMNQEESLDAYQVVNHYTYEELVRILWMYGEENYAKNIARAIEKQRAIKPIETTFQLVDVIKSALPNKVLNKKGHPAKQTFQAIRIEVNHELDSLKKCLYDALSILNVNGRLAVITFHSLEDRIVKQIFKEVSSVQDIDPKLPLREIDIKKPSYELVTKKPVVASQKENDENHRSHSAKLRVIERVGIEDESKKD